MHFNNIEITFCDNYFFSKFLVIAISLNKIFFFLKTLVSLLLIYLGMSSPVVLAPKPKTLLELLKIGIITLLEKKEYKLALFF